jgi:hypothetical protein
MNCNNPEDHHVPCIIYVISISHVKIEIEHNAVTPHDSIAVHTRTNVLYDLCTENEPVTEIEENFTMFVEVRMLLHDAQRVQGRGGLAV